VEELIFVGALHLLSQSTFWCCQCIRLSKCPS